MLQGPHMLSLMLPLLQRMALLIMHLLVLPFEPLELLLLHFKAMELLLPFKAKKLLLLPSKAKEVLVLHLQPNKQLQNN